MAMTIYCAVLIEIRQFVGQTTHSVSRWSITTPNWTCHIVLTQSVAAGLLTERILFPCRESTTICTACTWKGSRERAIQWRKKAQGSHARWSSLFLQEKIMKKKLSFTDLTFWVKNLTYLSNSLFSGDAILLYNSHSPRPHRTYLKKHEKCS